jgi:hypothetical protein
MLLVGNGAAGLIWSAYGATAMFLAAAIVAGVGVLPFLRSGMASQN